MKIRCLITFIIISFCLNTLNAEDVPGIYCEFDGQSTRYVPSLTGSSHTPERETQAVSNDRAQILWVDRNHLNAIAEHVAIAGNGMFIQTGWYLNNERTSLYRTLGTSTPQWTFPLANSSGYIPVDVSFTADGIITASPGEPIYNFTYQNPTPRWVQNLPGGFTVSASMQGPTVVVSDDGSLYGVLGRSGDIGRLFIYDSAGDTIRTITFNPTNGIYGLDASSDCSVFCVSTYNALYIYNFDGTRRDSLFHYGQTVAKISGDGSYVVKGGFNATVYLYRWNGSIYELVWQQNTGHPWVTAVAISRDASTIMAGTYQYSPNNTGKVALFDSSSATPLWEYTQYGDYVSSCALTEDGSRAAAGSWGQYNGTFGDVVTVFERASATPLFQILDDLDEPGSIFSVDISRDGSFVTAGGKAVHARQFGNGGETYAVRILDPLSSDVGVEDITSPEPFLQLGNTAMPQAIVKNFGTQADSFPAVCLIYDSLAQLLYAETLQVSLLLPDSSRIVTFPTLWVVPAYGTYETVVYTMLAGDEFPINDTLQQQSICYHDGCVTQINYPFEELTLNYDNSPRVVIMNRGSYTETINVLCEIYDETNTLIYTGSGQSYLSPLESASLILSPSWSPADSGQYTTYAFTDVTDDYYPGNDTMTTTTDVTTEIMYDDGKLNVYGYVSTNYYDNKFAERMTPCLPAPYYIPYARFYVSNSDPIVMSLHRDSLGLPGLGPFYYIAPPETVSASGTGWLVRTFLPPIEMTDTNPFWFVVHWLSTSPTSPFIGMDNTQPLDNNSYWYWTEPGNPGWHQWSYDFMMRVYTVSQVGITNEQNPSDLNHFFMHLPHPNPFLRRTSVNFAIPRPGILCLTIYDVTGRLICDFTERLSAPGTFTFDWDGQDISGRKVSSGIYFLHATYEQESVVKKVVLIAD